MCFFFPWLPRESCAPTSPRNPLHQKSCKTSGSWRHRCAGGSSWIPLRLESRQEGDCCWIGGADSSSKRPLPLESCQTIRWSGSLSASDATSEAERQGALLELLCEFYRRFSKPFGVQWWHIASWQCPHNGAKAVWPWRKSGTFFGAACLQSCLLFGAFFASSVDRRRCTPELSERFGSHWSIWISGEIRMDQSLGALFSGKICMDQWPRKFVKSFPQDWYWPYQSKGSTR